MNEGYYLCELAADFAEAWLCYHFIGLFLWKQPKRRGSFLMLSLILVLSVQGMKYLPIEPLIIILWFVFFICMTTVVLFQVDVFYSVSLVSFYILCVYIIDFFCLSVMGVLGGNREFASMVINQLSLWRVVYLVANKVLLVLFYLLARWALKRELFYSARMFFFVSFLGLLGVGFLSWLTMKETTVHSLFSWSMCLVILFLLYFLLRFYSDYQGERKLREFRELREQMVHQGFESLKQQQKERELLEHDMKNHMLVLRSLLEREQIEDAKHYLERVSEPFLKLAPVIWTGNETLDLLLNQMQQKARQHGILFTIQADAVSLEQMKEEDICSLFANLLDNAYEAAARGAIREDSSSDIGKDTYKNTVGDAGTDTGAGRQENASWICVKIRRAREMLFLEISNSMAEQPRIHGGALISSKEDNRLHGLGLESAKRTVERYGGTLEWGWEEGTFCVNVSFLGTIRPYETSF